MKIEYCMLCVECLIPIMNWHLTTINYKQHKAKKTLGTIGISKYFRHFKYFVT